MGVYAREYTDSGIFRKIQGPGVQGCAEPPCLLRKISLSVNTHANGCACTGIYG